MTFEYQHVNITELASEEVTYLDENGHTRTARRFNRRKLNRLLRERMDESMRVMQPFREWLIVHRGYNAVRAHRRGHLVFVALWETRNKPLEKLSRPDVAGARREELRGSLMHFCEWLLETSKDQEEIKWARDLLLSLSRLRNLIRSPTCVKPPVNPEETALKHTPFTPEEWQRIFDELEKWHMRYGARWPWARPLMRIQLICGMRRKCTALLMLERQKMHKLVLEKDKPGRIIQTWAQKGDHCTVIPFDLIEPECKVFLRLPVPWGTLYDLLIPGDHVDAGQRLGLALQRLNSAWAHFGAHSDAGVPTRGDGGKCYTFAARVLVTAKREVWKKTQDVLLMSGLFGQTLRQIQSLPFVGEDMTNAKDIELAKTGARFL
jgi:hypothetical protein